MEQWKERVRYRLSRMWLYAVTLCKWLAVGAFIGAVGGVVGSAFHIGVDHATELREITHGSSICCRWAAF